jgi:hypothetical protein
MSKKISFIFAVCISKYIYTYVQALQPYNRDGTAVTTIIH